MKALGRGFVLTIILAALAAAAGTWVGSRYLVYPHHTTSLHDRVHKELALTPEQERRLEVLERDFAFQRRSRESQLRAANAELAKVIRESHEDSPQVQAAVERIHGVMGELQKETILHVLAMRKVLAPDQAVKFDRLITEALTEQAP